MKTVLELEDLANTAVKAALNQQWDQAIALNQEYLQDSPDSIEALNRLARALQETGQTDQARQTYQQVLTIDPYNTIATKNLEKISTSSNAKLGTVSTELFLEEPGKTRIAPIVSPNTKKIATFASGQPLTIADRKGQLALLSPQGAVLGYLEESLSSHLKNLISLGNTYSAHLMSTTDTPQVFLRQTHQSAAASKYISFTKVHTSTISHLGSSRDHRLTSDEVSSEVIISDEELDNWDSENPDDLDSHDDDFDAVSLEQMRDDEDDSFSNSDY